MKLSMKFMLPALLAGLVLTSPARAQDAATRIAVANPSRIFQQMQETQDKNKTMEAERVTLNAEEQKRVQEIKDLRDPNGPLKFLKKGTPEHDKKMNEIVQKTVELQAWGEVKKAELGRRHKEEIKAIFIKIQATIAQIAQEKKIDLVLTDFGAELPEDLDQVTPEQLHGMIAQKNVLFAAKGVDISTEVTARLDAAYKK